MSLSPMARGAAIDRGLDFLIRCQEADGHLPSWVATDLEIQRDRRSDRSVFITQHIAASLLNLRDHRADRLIERAVAFLESEILPGGLWKFWTRDHPGFRAIPPDVDDTACVIHLLGRVGRSAPKLSRALLLGNRTPHGLFNTWILPRRGHLRHPRTWPALLQLLRHPLRLRAFFRRGLLTPGDLDAVVMTNVVLLLGSSPGTAATIAWLHAVVNDGREAGSDRYYQSPYPLYYAMARCSRHGCDAFEPLRERIVGRILAALQGPAVPLAALELALMAIVLQHWGTGGGEARQALERILAAQQDDGSWPAWGFFFSAGSRELAWGSEALTTAFCLEALADCNSQA